MAKTASVFLLTDPGLLSQYVNLVIPQTNVYELFVFLFFFIFSIFLLLIIIIPICQSCYSTNKCL